MAQDNEQICLLAFNVFGLICVIYSCMNIYDISTKYRGLDPIEQEECTVYLVWKIAFLLHVIFTFICLSFSVGTARSFIEEDDLRRNDTSNRTATRYRERFDKMIENSLDVVRVLCVFFCGPFILVECLLSIIYYNQILFACEQHIVDTFTNILIYVLIIMGCVSLTVTGFCCYMSYLFIKTVKDSWHEVRSNNNNNNPRPSRNR